jgi:hypothetical protein
VDDGDHVQAARGQPAPAQRWAMKVHQEHPRFS